MPDCFCHVHGCGAKGGSVVDPRTLKAHQRADRAVVAREAHAASKRIISAQDDDIATYLASMTLSDKVSSTAKQQGGRMWSKNSPNDEDLQTMTANFTSTPPEPPSPSHSPGNTYHPEPSRRAVTSALIQRLSEIDSLANKLVKDVHESLALIEYPSGNSSTLFPLKGLLATYKSVNDDLDRIRSKVLAVVEFQHSIREKLNEVRDSLTQAQSQWKSSQHQSQDTAVANKSCTLHNTGKKSLY